MRPSLTLFFKFYKSRRARAGGSAVRHRSYLTRLCQRVLQRQQLLFLPSRPMPCGSLATIAWASTSLSRHQPPFVRLLGRMWGLSLSGSVSRMPTSSGISFLRCWTPRWEENFQRTRVVAAADSQSVTSTAVGGSRSLLRDSWFTRRPHSGTRTCTGSHCIWLPDSLCEKVRSLSWSRPSLCLGVRLVRVRRTAWVAHGLTHYRSHCGSSSSSTQ